MTSAPWSGLQQAQSRSDQTKQNSGRLAFHAVTYTTHGWGTVLAPTPVTFDCTFIAEPAVTTGVAIESPKPGSSTTEFPLVTAGVADWVINDAGLYTGAYVYMTVVSSNPNGATTRSPLYVIHHHFVFQSIGLKNLPEHVLNDDPAPRSPGGL